MAIEKSKKEAGTEDNPTTAQETATRSGEAEEKGGAESGADAEGPEDPEMDQGSETEATGSKGTSDNEKAFLKQKTIVEPKLENP